MKPALVETLKALGDPLRLRILALLGRSELAVGELAQVLGVAQPRVSHHLKLLRDCGLVRVRREGAWTFCALERPGDGRVGPGVLQALESLAEKDLRPTKGDILRLEKVLEARRQRSRAFFDAAAGRWESLEPRLKGSGLRHQALSFLVDPGKTLVDVGCGAGFMARVLATRAGRVILVDHSPAMLEKARQALEGKVPARLEFRVGEVDALPLREGEAQGVFANLVLHHVPDLGKALAELVRVLDVGGTLVVSDLLPHQEEWLREEQADLRLGIDPEELAGHAERAGLEGVRYEEGADRIELRGKGGRTAELPLFLLGGRKASPGKGGKTKKKTGS